MARNKPKPPQEVVCSNNDCEIKFMKPPSHIGINNYCSRECMSKAYKGRTGYWSGKKMSAQHRKNLSDSHKPYWTPERKAEKALVTASLHAKGVYRTSNANRHSSLEYRLKPLLEQLGYKSTIDTPKFITYNGKTREPDFINPITRNIIEIFGSYHHRDQKGKVHETPEEYIEWHANADYNCRVIWDYELDEFENEILDMINQEVTN